MIEILVLLIALTILFILLFGKSIGAWLYAQFLWYSMELTNDEKEDKV